MSEITPIDSNISGNLGSYDAMGQGAVELLESITAAEKGQAVPYVQMWQLNPNTGTPLFPKPDDQSSPNYPLTAWTIAPPVFGASTDHFNELRERPAVSLDNVTIKTNNPYGVILYRQVEINFVVHRPDALASPQNKSENRDSWSSLITPGTIFAMEYGWSANEQQVKNPIINGTDAQGVSTVGRQWIVNGKKIIRLAVTNYRFTLLPDQQIQINVSAIEDGDYGMRHTYVVSNVQLRSPSNDPNLRIGPETAKFQAEFNKQAKIVQNQIKNQLFPFKIRNGAVNDVVRFEDVFKVFFADRVEESLKALGYQRVSFTMGCFNNRTPVPIDKHMWAKPKNGKTPSLYIGDFTIPYQDVIGNMSELIAHGTRLTAYNFITPFLKKFSEPTSWENLNESDKTAPDVQLRFVPYNDNGKQSAKIFVVDLKTELMRFTDTDALQFQIYSAQHSRDATNVANRDEIRRICNAKGIPYIEMMKGNSWIQDAQFDVIQDELVQSLFIVRNYPRDRYATAAKTETQIRDETFDHRKTLYSSAIKGQITAIGNHGMDVMGMYWLDFGVAQWSGPFRLFERDDILSRDGWQTTIRLFSEGTDPLGSQGRPGSKGLSRYDYPGP